MGYEDEREFDDYEWDIEHGFIDDPNGGLDDVEEEEIDTYGIDKDEFDLMDEYEKREALEDAGLDPDDFEEEYLF